MSSFRIYVKVDTANDKVACKSDRARGLRAVVTVTDRTSCPDTCPMRGRAAGCYAEAGYYTRTHWNAVDAGKRGGTLAEACATLETLPPDYVFRHNVAGDLPHAGGAIDRDAVLSLARAASHLRAAFTYTHHALTPTNIETLKEAAREGLTVNASAHGLAGADAAAETGLPVCTVLPSDAPKVSRTPRGLKVVTCPATYNDKVSCVSCLMCARANRPYAIGFPAHGPAARAAEATARD